MVMDAEDSALVEGFRRGEESAFAALVIKYREAVYRVARRMVHNHEDASDIAQEVFIRMHRALVRFAGRSSLRTWIFRITVNLCLDHTARRREVTGLDAMAWEPSSDDNPVEGGVERRELEDAVATAIDALPPRQRAMVVLRVYQDLPYADIARVMGCAEGTVKATMFAAVGKLRKALAPYVGDASR